MVKQLRDRLPRWRAAAGAIVLGLCVGLLTLLPAATAYPNLPGRHVLFSYLMNPALLALNVWPAAALLWLFYLLTGRGWMGYLCSALPCVGLSLAGYYKIRLRGDPLLGRDLLLLGEARGMAGRYTLDVTGTLWVTAACFLLGLLVSLLLLPRLEGRWRVRLPLALGCLVLAGAVYVLYCRDDGAYQRAVNQRLLDDGTVNRWSDVEVFVSKGFLYPFAHSLKDMLPTPPQGYDKARAKALLEAYPGADLPEGKKADVVAVMLEAFCDLTDFSALEAQSAVRAVYEPLHALEAQSVSGDLLTNIFAGGTVDSEWCFLTGYSRYDDFRSPADSYVWYLRNQGYDAVFHHPGFSWFYNRRNINEYLGFRESLFTENFFGEIVNPYRAVWRSDKELAEVLLGELEERGEDPPPYFSFSVTYQNHGPYDGESSDETFVTPEETGWTAESCNILNNYLSGVSDTIQNLLLLRDGLEALDRPVVLVFFGDHKPWLGNGESVYHEIGASFDLGTLEGFSSYYGTPYVIWANSAAKQALGENFAGDGGDFSPCFLMPKLFDLCGWEGPGYMELSRRMREISPLVHARSLFLTDGALTDRLEPEAAAFYQEFLGAQYCRQHELRLAG